jgi:hypothetical protein
MTGERKEGRSAGTMEGMLAWNRRSCKGKLPSPTSSPEFLAPPPKSTHPLPVRIILIKIKIKIITDNHSPPMHPHENGVSSTCSPIARRDHPGDRSAKRLHIQNKTKKASHSASMLHPVCYTPLSVRPGSRARATASRAPRER